MGELFGGGETHADIVSKLAALSTTIQSCQVLQSHKPVISESLHLFVGLCSDEKRAQSLPSAGYRRKCYACQEKIFKRDLYETSGSRSRAPPAFARNK